MNIYIPPQRWGTDRLIFMYKTIPWVLTAGLALSACDSENNACDYVNVSSPADSQPGLRSDFTPPDFSDLMSYNSSSAYAEALSTCPGLYQQNRVCTLGELPPLSQDSSEVPTVDEIMDRVSVSHEWMGANFQRALESEDLLPEVIRILARPLAAIVIDADIRPSFFLNSTGTIYLDPKYLWLTQEEKDTISEKEDFRSAYAAQMTTLPAWRYVDGDNYAYSSNSANSRTEEDMAQSLARLLFHELAHANDFIELDRLPYANTEDGFYVLLNDDGGQMSKSVQNSAPLQSCTLRDYAAALYLGATANVQTTTLRGGSAGAALDSEGANATYGYTTRFEDFAMMVEETLMFQYYGFQRDAAFIEQDVVGVDSEGNDIVNNTVRWGQRGRIGAPLVKARAQAAMEQLLPNTQWSTFFDGLATPNSMVASQTWEQNLSSSASDTRQLSLDEVKRSATNFADDFAHPHH